MALDLSPSKLSRGAAAGLVAAIAMGIYAMLASLSKDTGFFTPMYHIASSISFPTAMMHSMKAAGAGDGTFFDAGSAVLGAVIHMMVGAVAGVVFVALVSLRPISRLGTVAAGIVFGLVVMAVNSLVVLPVTAAVLGGGDPIAHMGRVAGWTTFTIEHVIYGLVLGVIVAALVRSTETRSSTSVGLNPTHS